MPELPGVALISGVSSGIGRQLAEGLAARGMAVAGLARNGEKLRTAMEEVAAATGGRTLAVACDVTDRTAVDAAVGRVRGELGNVDLLVNNAGLIDAAEVPLWEADPGQWWDVVSSHVRGGFLLSRVAAVAAVAAGELDHWGGRFVRVGADDLDTLRAHPGRRRRMLRLRPYGEDDPLG